MAFAWLKMCCTECENQRFMISYTNLWWTSMIIFKRFDLSLIVAFWRAEKYHVRSSRVHKTSWPSADPDRQQWWLTLQIICLSCQLLILSCGSFLLHVATSSTSSASLCYGLFFLPIAHSCIDISCYVCSVCSIWQGYSVYLLSLYWWRREQSPRYHLQNLISFHNHV